MSELPDGAEVIDPPQYLPEGWRAVRLTYASGSSIGDTYLRYYGPNHKCISSIKKCIELDAKDRGLDPVVEVKAFEDKKASQQRSDVPPEQFADFGPDQSGLDSEVLAALPPDAPPESEAFAKVRIGSDSAGNLRAGFKHSQAGSKDIFMQVTKAAALDNLYAAFRITRACYLMIQDGFSKGCGSRFQKGVLGQIETLRRGQKQGEAGPEQKKERNA